MLIYQNNLSQNLSKTRFDYENKKNSKLKIYIHEEVTLDVMSLINIRNKLERKGGVERC